MMTRIVAFKIIATGVVVILLALLQCALNINKRRRGRQVILPAVSFGYSVIAVIIVSVYSEKLLFLIGTLLNFAFLRDSEIVLLNVVILLVFSVLKLALHFVVDAKWKNDRLMDATAGRYYEYGEIYREWYLKGTWVNCRQILKGLCVCAGAVSAALLALTWISGRSSGAWLFCFPGAVLLVMLELWSFLNGQTKAEFAHSITGDESVSQRIGNFQRLREIYEKLFPKLVLSAAAGCEFISQKGPSELLRQFAQSEDKLERTTAEYFGANYADTVLDVDSMQATVKLMKRENVVFFNPFYRDLGNYITLPLINALLSDKKCLVITGRNTTREDVTEWLAGLVSGYCHMRALWRVRELDNKSPECEVGVLSLQRLYDLAVLRANRDFFYDVDFILLVEPSLTLTTGQVGLNILAGEMEKRGEKPVYCICDRKADGLIDTLSHLLRAEITEAVAPPVPRCAYTGMAWDADGDYMRQQMFDKQARYLGNGIELSAAAIKNQIPEVVWYSETKSPVKDIKWIAGQFYPSICRYMNLPSQQKSIYEKVHFVSNLWCAPEKREHFIIAEDEFCNMFGMIRLYLSRGREQAFVNVVSESYLLRDYMRCNSRVFLSDPNAIPSCVPDYAKTLRNTVLKLVLMMAFRMVSEEEVAYELSLAGYESGDAFGSLFSLVKKYTFADDSIFTLSGAGADGEEPSRLSITCETFEKYFSDSLRHAYYILEDEKCGAEFVEAKLFGHITQTILPGQFVTYGGKYYEVKRISAKYGVVLRRASDLYNCRKYYRQVREYEFAASVENEAVGTRRIMDVELTKLCQTLSVATTGYLDMRSNHDLRTARLMDFTGDPSFAGYTRSYRNKDVLRVFFPDMSDTMRFTLCMLLSEALRSIYPDAWQYIAVVAARPEGIEGMLNYVVYALKGDMRDDCVYIIEDSDMDLGLIDSIDRNFMRLMEIVADFLEWHSEKMREPEQKDPVMGEPKLPADEKKRSLFLRMAESIRKFFGQSQENRPASAGGKGAARPGLTMQPSAAAPQPVVAPPPKEYALEGDMPDGAASPEAVEPEISYDDTRVHAYALDTASAEPDQVANMAPLAQAGGAADAPPQSGNVRTAATYDEDGVLPSDGQDADFVHIDGTDIFEDGGLPEDSEYLEAAFAAAGITPMRQSRYQRECFLKFGFAEIDSRIQADEVRKYLRVRGCSYGDLFKARKRELVKTSLIDTDAVNHCDFCEIPLSGVSYEILNDGRIRCNDCAASAISSVEELRELFYRMLRLMEGVYFVSFHVPIDVQMADARKIARNTGRLFRPTTAVAQRVLGYARKVNGQYCLMIENGSPRLAAIDTMVHELTHVWQYINWDDKAIREHYGNDRNRDIVYEGMASWAAIQCLYQVGESGYAGQQEAMLQTQDDVYGTGFKLYAERYPLVKDTSTLKFSPFSAFPPLPV